eukprot:COSAG05_NODE_1059_length_6003_cov_3.124492_3_plen_111_part_00
MKKVGKHATKAAINVGKGAVEAVGEALQGKGDDAHGKFMDATHSYCVIMSMKYQNYFGISCICAVKLYVNLQSLSNEVDSCTRVDSCTASRFLHPQIKIPILALCEAYKS